MGRRNAAVGGLIKLRTGGEWVMIIRPAMVLRLLVPGLKLWHGEGVNRSVFRMRGNDLLRISASLACMLTMMMTTIGARAEGVAVLKEQPFHRDSSAKAVTYQKISTTGPYLRLVTYRGNVDIVRSKMVDRIEFPDPPPPVLMEEADFAPFRSSLAAMKAFASRYPASATLLKPEMDVVSRYVAHFDAGDVRYDGKWISKDHLPGLLESQQSEAKKLRRQEVEKVVEDEAEQEMGRVRVNGSWVSEEEALERSPTASTQLSAALWPLANPDMAGARRALQNLSDVAAGQTGAVKIRTERLHTMLHNLFLAEFRLSQEMIAATAAEAQAAKHDRQTEDWLKPNAFGTERDEAARESLAKAGQLRDRAGKALEIRRADLLRQLGEGDLVTEDFHKLRELRVALVLGETVRAVGARTFTVDEFQSSFPEETLTSIRGEIDSAK